MKANYNRRTQSEVVRVSNILTNAIQNNGIIAKSQLVDCMVSMLDKSADKKTWKMLIEYSLSAGQYADQIFSVRKVNETHCQITKLRDPNTLKTIFSI